jgi:repressor of nif and glnA expression
MSTRTDNAKLAILKILNELNESAGASRITERLSAMGIHLQPRTVRFYLLQMDQNGLTECVSRRKGRMITAKGRDEVSHAHVMEKVGFAGSKVDTLGYRMSYNTHSQNGTIITNLAMLRSRDLSRALAEIRPVFMKHLSMGSRLTVARSGEKIAGTHVPGGMIAIATVCSVTLNGILLSNGIPVTSRFGGLVEMRDGKPLRFVELMEYAGTTVDPLETFTKAGMTQVRECAGSGYGIIGASFREIPSIAVEQARRTWSHLQKQGLGGILAVGPPGQPLLDIPVSQGRTGIIVVGGLNPMAAIYESGIQTSIKSLCELEDYSRFSSFDQIFRQYMNSLR